MSDNYDYNDNLTISVYDHLSDDDFENFFGDAVPITIKSYLTDTQIGLIHFCLASIFMILQILVFSSFFNKKELFKKTCFQIMFNHGILSFIQQLCHIITSITVIFNIKASPELFQIVGSLLSAAYIGSIAFIFLLTLNRFDILYSVGILHNDQKKYFYMFGIILCYLFTISIFVTYFILPQCKLIFSSVTFEWVFDDFESSRTAYQFEKKSIYSFLGISLILQILILLKVFTIRCGTSGRIVIVADDLKIIFHALLCFVTALFLELIWDGVVFEIYWTGIFLIMPHILFIFCTISNSVFILFFVREIRRNVFAYKYVQSKIQSMTVTRTTKGSFNITTKSIV